MRNFRRINILNKLIILIGLFFMFNLSFSQNKIVDSNYKQKYELKLFAPIYNNIGGAKQILISSENRIRLINIKNGLTISEYEIIRKEKVLNKYSEKYYTYGYDSLNRLVSTKTRTSNCLTIDSIHYNSKGRIDYYQSSMKGKKRAMHYGSIITFNNIKLNDNFYELISNDKNNDTIKLNYSNQILKSDSIQFIIENDTVKKNIYGLNREQDSIILTVQENYFEDKIVFRKTYYTKTFPPQISSVTSYYYNSQARLIMIKYKDKFETSLYLKEYNSKGNIKREIDIFYDCFNEFSKTITNYYYISEVKYQNKDLKSMF